MIWSDSQSHHIAVSVLFVGTCLSDIQSSGGRCLGEAQLFVPIWGWDPHTVHGVVLTTDQMSSEIGLSW